LLIQLLLSKLDQRGALLNYTLTAWILSFHLA
jgi:hypothetical protein